VLLVIDVIMPSVCTSARVLACVCVAYLYFVRPF